MLLGTFYKILESGKDGETLSAKIEFNPAHDIFKGHFPQLPAVPGVCQTQMLEEILSFILGKNLQLAEASQIKFLDLVNPTITKQLSVEIKISEDGGKMGVQAKYFWGEVSFFRFRGTFK